MYIYIFLLLLRRYSVQRRFAITIPVFCCSRSATLFLSWTYVCIPTSCLILSINVLHSSAYLSTWSIHINRLFFIHRRMVHRSWTRLKILWFDTLSIYGTPISRCQHQISNACNFCLSFTDMAQISAPYRFRLWVNSP